MHSAFPADAPSAVKPEHETHRLADAGGPVAIVAELRANHHGNRDRLARLIRTSSEAGADYIKVQKRDVATFYSAAQLEAPFESPFGRTFGDYREHVELTADDFELIAGLSEELKVGWYASVLDRNSFEFVMAFDPAMVKIPSTISDNEPFLSWVADNYRGDIVISTGMADQTYVDWIIEKFAGNRRLFLLQCTSAYPTPPQDCCIAVVRNYARLAETHAMLIPGYSSHDAGWRGSALAVAAGARMLEKHVTLEPVEGVQQDPVALDLTTSAFSEYVSEIRLAERLMGTPMKTVRPSENHKYSHR